MHGHHRPGVLPGPLTRASRLVHATPGDSAGIGFQIWLPAPYGAGQCMRSQRINFGLEGRNGHGMGGSPGVVTTAR